MPNVTSSAIFVLLYFTCISYMYKMLLLLLKYSVSSTISTLEEVVRVKQYSLTSGLFVIITALLSDP